MFDPVKCFGVVNKTHVKVLLHFSFYTMVLSMYVAFAVPLLFTKPHISSSFSDLTLIIPCPEHVILSRILVMWFMTLVLCYPHSVAPVLFRFLFLFLFCF